MRIELAPLADTRTELWRWDTGRQINIVPDEGVAVDEVHFATSAIKEALVVIVKEADGRIVAEVPNTLLRSAIPIDVYMVTHTDNGERTIHHVRYNVRNRAKPSDYTYTETEVLRYEQLEARIEKLEQGGTSGGESPEFEKVAEILMNTETVIYEFASMADYSEILVYMKRTYDGSSGTGTVEYRLEDENGNYKKLYSSSNGIKGKNSQVHVKVSGDVIETIASTGNSVSDTAVYSVVIDEELASNGMFKLKMTESWAAIVKDGDTITVYGKRRS